MTHTYEENRDLTLDFIYEQLGKKRFKDTGLRYSKFALIRERYKPDNKTKDTAARRSKYE